MFWSHVGQVCGSLYVAKFIVKAGSAGKEAITRVIGEIIDVKFAQKHMELPQANVEWYSNHCNHVRIGSKMLKYFVKRAQLRNHESRSGLRATDLSANDKLLLKLFTSGKLKSDAKLATDMYVALKRREEDAFADVMTKRIREDGGDLMLGDEFEQERVLIKSWKTCVGTCVVTFGCLHRWMYQQI